MTMPSIFARTEQDTGPEPWQLRYDDLAGDFPDGIRISTDCQCRRLREFKAPDEYRAFPEELAARGHGFERIIRENLEREGHTVVRELTVPWAHGETHVDMVITSGPRVEAAGRWLVYECKANADGAMYPENMRQATRQRRVVELALAAGLVPQAPHMDGESIVFDPWPHLDQLAEADWRILVVDPRSWKILVPDGHPVQLSEERRQEVDAELENVDRFMAILPTLDPYYESEWPECSCGKCWPPPISDLPETLYQQAATYCEAHENGKYAANEKKIAAAIIKETLERRRLHLGLEAEDRRAWEGGGYRISQTANGALRVTTMSERKALGL